MDYNKAYYKKALSILEDTRFNHYYGNLIEDCAGYLQCYFPDADLKDIKHAIRWALADAWNGGCEVVEGET